MVRGMEKSESEEKNRKCLRRQELIFNLAIGLGLGLGLSKRTYLNKDLKAV